MYSILFYHCHKHTRTPTHTHTRTHTQTHTQTDTHTGSLSIPGVLVQCMLFVDDYNFPGSVVEPQCWYKVNIKAAGKTN